MTINTAAFAAFNPFPAYTWGTNSADLLYIEAAGNAGTVISAGSTNIDFIEVLDAENAWSSNEFTAPRTSTYTLEGAVFETPAANNQIDVYKDTGGGYTLLRKASEIQNSQAHTFKITEQLNAGDKLALRMITGSQLSNSTTEHWLRIKEIPTQASVVENLAASATLCQTKTLNAPTLTTAAVLLTFSNLTVGKYYKAKAAASIANSGTLSINHNSSQIVLATNTSGAFLDTRVNSPVFQAAATTATLENPDTVQVYGDDTTRETWMELCELPDSYVQTTKF